MRLQSWMRDLENKKLGNGALVAEDYQTGELIAYVGSADYYGNPSKRMQPQFDVASKGYRQPGSAFKPIMYSIGIDDKRFAAGSMFMDVVTDFGGGYTPTDADRLERGPVRLRDALRFSLNIPAVKAVTVAGPERVFARSQEFGLRYASDSSTPDRPSPLGSRRSIRSTWWARTARSRTAASRSPRRPSSRSPTRTAGPS